MRHAILTTALLFAAAASGYAQDATPPVDCPAGYICLTRAAAEAALQAGDKVKALESELKANQDATEILRKALNDMRIEFARVSGENTALKQNAVSDRAIIEAMLKMVRKKCMPLSVCF